MKYQLAFAVINTIKVAPVRERGLKLSGNLYTDRMAGRSRKGAWIEIAPKLGISAAKWSLP